MRSQLNKYLSIVLIAVWAQIVAPIVPYFAMAAAAFNAQASVEFCVSGEHHQPASHHVSTDCQQCCLAHYDPGLFSGVEAGVSSIIRSPLQIHWLDRAQALLAGRRNAHAQARASPFFS